MFDPRTKLSEQVVEEVQRLLRRARVRRHHPEDRSPVGGAGLRPADHGVRPEVQGRASAIASSGREVALRPPPTEPDADLRRPARRSCVPADRTPSPAARRAARSRTSSDEVPTVHDRRWTPTPRRSPRPAEADRGRPRSPRPEPSPPTKPQPEPVAAETTAARAGAPSPLRRPEPAPTRARTGDRAPAPSRGAPVGRIGRSRRRRRLDDDDDVWEDGRPNASRARVAPPRSPAPPGHLPERRVVVIDEDADIAAPASEPTRSAGRIRRRSRRGATGRRRHRRHAARTRTTPASADGDCSAREASDVETRWSGPGAVGADPRRARGRRRVLRAARGARQRGRAQPQAARTHWDEEEIESLAASIREVGILQPIVVRKSGETDTSWSRASAVCAPPRSPASRPCRWCCATPATPISCAKR